MFPPDNKRVFTLRCRDNRLAKHSALIGRRDAAGGNLRNLKEQIARDMFESGKTDSKQITAILQGESELRLLDEAVSGPAQATMTALHHAVLGAKFAAAQGALAAHQTHLRLHELNVKEQLRGLNGLVESIEVTSLGSKADDLAREIVALEKALTNARRNAQAHAVTNVARPSREPSILRSKTYKCSHRKTNTPSIRKLQRASALQSSMRNCLQRESQTAGRVYGALGVCRIAANRPDHERSIGLKGGYGLPLLRTREGRVALRERRASVASSH